MQVARRGNTVTFELQDRVFTAKIWDVVELHDKLEKIITKEDRTKAKDKADKDD